MARTLLRAPARLWGGGLETAGTRRETKGDSGLGNPSRRRTWRMDRRPSLDIARTQSVTLGTYRSVGSLATAEARSESRRYASRGEVGLCVLVGSGLTFGRRGGYGTDVGCSVETAGTKRKATRAWGTASRRRT
jgi:hypothetical protein